MIDAAERFAAENTRRQQLAAQAAALLAGRPEDAPRSQMPVLFPGAAPANNTRAPVDRTEAIKTLGLYRKNVRMRPVISGYTPNRTWKTIVFPYAAGQALTKLSRSVSREWVQILTSVSSTSLAAGDYPDGRPRRVDGSQGRNLIRIVEELRKHAYLRLGADGQPVEVREQVIQVVDGEGFCFARECGLSPATFYRALGHPLAHLFIRTQKVQRVDADGERRNVATLFSVALYEPLIPADLEAAYWSENLDTGEIFTVPAYNSQVEGTKGRPLINQKQNVACGKLTRRLGGDLDSQKRDEFLSWIDSAALISRAGTEKTPVVPVEAGLEGCIDRLRDANPGLWEFATQIAIHHDEPATQAAAAVGYYKALVHLGVGRVRYWVQRLERWRLKGQKIETPGKLLMHHLNREARAATGFPIRDLGTEPGGHVS